MGWPFTGVEKRLDSVRAEFVGLRQTLDSLSSKLESLLELKSGISGIRDEVAFQAEKGLGALGMVNGALNTLNSDLHNITVNVPPTDFSPILQSLQAVVTSTQGMQATMQQGFQNLGQIMAVR